MKRRDFFKAVTGFIAGVFATSVEGKKRSGTRYCGEASTGIDPNSEWAKQEPLTLDMLIRVKEELEIAQKDDWIDVRDFGAIDDTKMIQEAIGLAKDGGVVYFSKGTYNHLRYGIIV